MVKLISNPFASSGTMIGGSRFIGRASEIRTVHAKVLSDDHASIAIVGMPRIGKSSLANVALQEFPRDELKSLGAAVARLVMGEHLELADFLTALVQEGRAALQGAGISSAVVERAAQECVSRRDANQLDAVRAFFDVVRAQKTRIVYILDEFDSARRLLVGSPHILHWLREAMSNARFKQAFVLISKRHLSDIARMAGLESTYWANVLDTLRLAGFDDASMRQYWEGLATHRVAVSPPQRALVHELCGGHPFLLDLFAFRAFERVNHGASIEDGWIRETLDLLHRGYIPEVAKVLGDGPLLDKLEQVLIGPQLDVTRDDVLTLVDYGVLRDANPARAFSEPFARYLEGLRRPAQYWPLWRDTELTLRLHVEDRLIAVHGDDWVSGLSKRHPRLASVLEACASRAKTERTKRYAVGPSSILDYTYPDELWQILSADWPEIGGRILGAQAGWQQKFQLLTTVRTPVAHNRIGIVDPATIRQAEGICEEIQACLKNRGPTA